VDILDAFSHHINSNIVYFQLFHISTLPVVLLAIQGTVYIFPEEKKQQYAYCCLDFLQFASS